MERKYWILVIGDEGKDWKLLSDHEQAFLIQVDKAGLHEIVNGSNPLSLSAEPNSKMTIGVAADGSLEMRRILGTRKEDVTPP